MPRLLSRYRRRDSSDFRRTSSTDSARTKRITRRVGGWAGLSIANHLVEYTAVLSRREPRFGRGPRSPLSCRQRGSARAGDATDGVSNDAAQPRDSLTGLRILVVEDEQDTRELLDRLLRSYGADILLVRSADEALSRLSGGHVDLVVSDIGLPDIDGYDLMQRIRQLPANDGGATPAIALTYGPAEGIALAPSALGIRRTWRNRSISRTGDHRQFAVMSAAPVAPSTG